MKRRPIGLRLTAWYALILAATFAIGGIGVWVALGDSINDTVDGELHSRMRAMRTYIDRESAEGNQLTHELAEDAAFAPAGTQFRIADANGTWLYRSPGTESWGAPPSAAGLPNRGLSRTIYEKGEPVRILTAAAPPGLIQIGIPLDEFSEVLTGFAWTALLAIPILLLLASAGGYWMSKRALAPVELITRSAGEIEAKDLSQRLPLRGTGDELDRLSEKLNGMFGRLERSFRRITQFTADASHELRTPVSIIRITAEVTLARPRSAEEYSKALEQILAESERTSSLIDDLMLLARADSREDEPPSETVDLAELSQLACEDARRLAAASGAILKASGEAPCVVRGDHDSLRRLALILIDNAIKYSLPGGEIELRIRSEADQGVAMGVLEVRDSGIGISEEDVPHIFERFYRAAKDRSRDVDGFGLGLPIAQAIAARHGGRIDVESRLGAGSVFRVLLPAV